MGAVLTPLEPQSRFGDKLLEIRLVCPQNGTALLKGLRRSAIFGETRKEHVDTHSSSYFWYYSVASIDTIRFFLGGGRGSVSASPLRCEYCSTVVYIPMEIFRALLGS